MMIIFRAFKDAHNEILKSEYGLNEFLKRSKILEKIKKATFGKSTSPHKVGSRAQRSELGLFQVGATVDARHVKVFVWSNLKSILFKSVLHVKFQIYSN